MNQNKTMYNIIIEQGITDSNQIPENIRLEVKSRPVNILASPKDNGIKDGDTIRIHHNLKGGSSLK